MSHKIKVIVAMSGGVDSSVAAWLLKEQGYAVEGMFMKNWELDDTDSYCAAKQDLVDAQEICDQLKIQLHCKNFSQQYWDQVFSNFLNEYQHGRTPNPDVLCNKEIKFKAFFEQASNYGANFIATGHYATVHDGLLYRSKDRAKDQTYFLHAINPKVLNYTLFPIGRYLKQEVRSIAKKIGLITHAKKDSTGICFIGEKKFKTFLQEFMLNKPGNIVDSQGEYRGRHDGLMFYTLGQRRGLGIGGNKDTLNQTAWYVVAKNLQENTLVVAQGEHNPLLYTHKLMVHHIHWLIKSPPTLPYVCQAAIRYRQIAQQCIIKDTITNQYCISFINPQRAVTPGQYVVFYDQDQCIGGGVIEC